MSAVVASEIATSVASRPVVIVGGGPVGVRVAQELARLEPERSVVLFGSEQWQPYNRVRLSSLVAGDLGIDALYEGVSLPTHSAFEARFGCAVAHVDRENQRVTDACGRSQRYSILVLAMGSTPHVPQIPGISLPGVFTFRDLADAQRLLARRMRSRRTVVLGGGLLGLEAARAMRRFNTEVTVVEHAQRLMPRQLDDVAAALLKARLEAIGIAAHVGDGVRRVLGEAHVTGIELMSGMRLDCDTVIVATGIRPNVDLARRAGIAVHNGIRVDDFLRTSDPDIYAVGECAEHRGVVYGLLAPGMEQALVAASLITGRQSRYVGSTSATRLKVAGLPVFSIGCVTDEDMGDRARAYAWRTRDGNAYSRIVIERGRLAGATSIDGSAALGRLQEAVTNRRRIWPWQRVRFVLRGELWPSEANTSVAHWPANVTVCNCTGVTRGQLTQAIGSGCRSVAAIAARTGASSVCGSCRPQLIELLGGSQPLEPEKRWRTLAGVAFVSLLVGVLMLLPWSIPYRPSVQLPMAWDELWREEHYKQISGFTLMGLSVIALAMSLRKRIKVFSAGSFSMWRIVHGLVGALMLVALLTHTGARLGHNLDLALTGSFLALIVIGGGAAVAIAFQHRMSAAAAVLRRRAIWTHILLFWPVPVLLAFHVLKAYYF
jgi:nitrite reductase (NADH) large subunit